MLTPGAFSDTRLHVCYYIHLHQTRVGRVGIRMCGIAARL